MLLSLFNNNNSCKRIFIASWQGKSPLGKPFWGKLQETAVWIELRVRERIKKYIYIFYCHIIDFIDII